MCESTTILERPLSMPLVLTPIFSRFRALLACLCSLVVLSGCVTQQVSDSQYSELAEQLEQQAEALQLQEKKIQQLENALESSRTNIAVLNFALDDLRHTTQQQAQVKITKPVKSPQAIKAQEKNPTEKIESLKNVAETFTLGRVEWVYLDAFEKPFKSRVDTGASSSSLIALDIQSFERDGKNWVRFKLDRDSETSHEFPVEKYVKIRQAGIKKEERRPVIRLRLRLGNINEEALFTLVNRENMLYPMLLGRSFLQDFAVVDVSKTFTQKKIEASDI